MGRVQRQGQGPAFVGGHAAARHNEQVKQSKPEYKVQLEQVTQKKKKLLSMTTYKIQAPTGYTFIPLTAPELTDKCKELARIDGLQVHVVSTSKGGKNSTELSKQVGRVGHHFPSSIVARALTSLGYDIDRSGHILSDFQQLTKGIGNEASRKEQKGTRIGDGITSTEELKRIQERLNNDAHTSLSSLFPRMPDKDRKAVVKHAFAIGKDRIGSSAELSIDRRVHLAVLAHIRHGYTDYDKLLKQVPYQTARSIVERKTLQKIVEWRGEGDNDEGVEEILREVIVIDDDEDEPISPNQLTIENGDDEEIQFRSSPIAPDKVESRPYGMVPVYDRFQAPLSTVHQMPRSRDHYVRVIDPERQRRYDNRLRDAWQEAKRTYREAIPVSSDAYVPSEHLRPVKYDHRVPAQEIVGQIPTERRITSAASRPQVVVLNQLQVGVSRGPNRGYVVEAATTEHSLPGRRTPESREIIHQSIEDVPQEQGKDIIQEVIVLDSPTRRQSGSSKTSCLVPMPSERFNVNQTLRNGRESTQAQGQPVLGKRAFDQVDQLTASEQPVRPYSNKIIQLSSGGDHRARQMFEESPPKIRATEYISTDRNVRSLRHPDYGPQRANGPTPIDASLHFYQKKSVPSPKQITQSVLTSRGTDAKWTNEQVFPSNHSVQTSGTETIRSSRDARPPTYAETGQYHPPDAHATVGPYHRKNSVQYPAISGPQNLSMPLANDHYRAGYNRNMTSFGSSNTVPDGAVGPHVYESNRPEDGVRQHLQRLHFYEPPRAAPSAAPRRFFDEQGREIIVVERR